MYSNHPLFGPSHGAGAVGVVLDVLERAENGPELAQEAAAIVVVQVTKDRLDGLSSLVSLVERNATRICQRSAREIFHDERQSLREQVVNNVLLNDAVEEVLADEAELTVDGGNGTLDESPALLGVVVDLRVVVVEVSDGN